MDAVLCNIPLGAVADFLKRQENQKLRIVHKMGGSGSTMSIRKHQVRLNYYRETNTLVILGKLRHVSVREEYFAAYGLLRDHTACVSNRDALLEIIYDGHRSVDSFPDGIPTIAPGWNALDLLRQFASDVAKFIDNWRPPQLKRSADDVPPDGDEMKTTHGGKESKLRDIGAYSAKHDRYV